MALVPKASTVVRVALLAGALGLVAAGCSDDGKDTAVDSPAACARSFEAARARVAADPARRSRFQLETMQRCGSKAEWMSVAATHRGPGQLIPEGASLAQLWSSHCHENADLSACKQ